MFLASKLPVENEYGDLTILCLEDSIPLYELKVQEFQNT